MTTIDFTYNVSGDKSYQIGKDNVKFSTETFVKSIKLDTSKLNKTISTITRGQYATTYKDFVITKDFEKGDYTHSNLIQYIAIAYANEHGIILRPDMFHFTILS